MARLTHQVPGQNDHVAWSYRLHIRNRAEDLVAAAVASELHFDYHEMAIGKEL